ncbi:MAG: paraquat-inducible protein A [Planctomycetota bacterium]
MSAAAPAAAPRSRHLTCHDCHLVIDDPGVLPPGATLTCPRCGATVHHRKPNSIARTWALVVAALLCYVPANVYPIMAVTSLGTTSEDTILSGAAYLLHHGMWPLALIIFIASVFVPLAKLLSLMLLLVSVQRRWQWRPVDRTRIYRITEAVGRWSMVDVYVVTILVALVHVGSLASIAARPGAFFFGAVVVLTIFAAESFDPRLIWDRLDPEPAAEPAS